jgi:hypothetical protein
MRLPFLFEPVAQLYWSAIFVVVTLYAFVILDGILRRAAEEILGIHHLLDTREVAVQFTTVRRVT